MIRISILCSALVLSACSVSPDSTSNKTNTAASQTEPATKQPVSDALASLMDLVEKQGRATHRFSMAEIELLFRQAVAQAETTLQIDLSGVQMLAGDQKAFRSVFDKQLKESAHLLPENFQNSWLFKDVATAIYDHNTDTIHLHPEIERRFPVVVGKSRALAQEFLLFVFLHELVHAADNRMGRINLKWSTLREATNAAIVREGHAQYWAKKMCSVSECQNYVSKEQGFTDDQNAGLTNEAGMRVFYSTGENFIAHFHKQTEKTDLLELAFAKPPMDEYQILLPELYPDTSRNQLNSRIIQTISTVPMPWKDKGYTALVTNTIDLNGLRRAANPQNRKNLRQFADIIRGDGTISYIHSKRVSAHNISVQSFHSKALSFRIYKALVKTHRTAKGISATYGIVPENWKTDSADLDIAGAREKIRYFAGVSNNKKRSDNNQQNLPFRVAVLTSGNFVVRLYSIEDTPYDLVKVGSEVLQRLIRDEPVQ